MIDPASIQPPTPSQRRVFAVMLACFFALLGILGDMRPGALAVAALVTGLATLGSMLLNRDLPMRVQWMGWMIPFALGLMAWLGRLDHDGFWLTLVMGMHGLVFGVAVWSWPWLGNRVYQRWLLAAVPIGWSLSALVLMLMYYLVLTPIGLVMRLCGRDAMNRRFDHDAPSYWGPHQPAADKRRYFRQY